MVCGSGLGFAKAEHRSVSVVDSRGAATARAGRRQRLGGDVGLLAAVRGVATNDSERGVVVVREHG